MIAKVLDLKIGDTIDCTGTHRDSDGNPIDLTAAGITVNSSVRQDDGTVHSLAVEILDQAAHPGEFRITGETGQWSPGKCNLWDIRYTNADGHSYSTDTIQIRLAEKIS